jgi:hypothetical protein
VAVSYLHRSAAGSAPVFRCDPSSVVSLCSATFRLTFAQYFVLDMRHKSPQCCGRRRICEQLTIQRPHARRCSDLVQGGAIYGRMTWLQKSRILDRSTTIRERVPMEMHTIIGNQTSSNRS